jgi:TonB-linked SusC/RagA family outer membrane protein
MLKRCSGKYSLVSLTSTEILPSSASQPFFTLGGMKNFNANRVRHIIFLRVYLTKLNYMRKFLSGVLHICLILITLTAWAQERTITGNVKDNAGAPVPGVNVVLKGTSNGTVTDADGNYSLVVPGSGGTLVFTFVGLTTQEVVIGTQSTVDVSMQSDITQLSEVVVSALGLEQNRDELGTASSQVKGAAVARSGEPTLINGLAGKASGINIARTSGDPGAGSYIQIRGQSTITGNLQPLIVLDGVPIFNSTVGSGIDGVVQQSRLNDINPSDIESVEILKGASAAALWGTRAANGVMVITTKKGASEKGKINISLNSTYSVDRVYLTHPTTNNWGSGTAMRYRFTPTGGWSWGDYIPDRTGGADETVTEGAGYQGYFEANDGTRFYAIPNGTAADPHGGKNSKDVFPYQDYLFKNGAFWDNTISLNGGDRDGNFYLSVGNLSQQGVMRYNSNYDRTTIRFNSSKRFSDIVRLASSFSYSATKSNRVQMGSNPSGLYLGGLRQSPDFNGNYFEGNFVDPDGIVFPNRQRSYRNPLGANTNSVYDNPLWTMLRNPSTTQVDRFIGSAELGVKPMKWLDLTARFGIDSYSDRRKDFFDPLSSTNPGGRLTLQTIRETQINADVFGQAHVNLSDKLTMTPLVGFNLNQRVFDNIGASTNSFIITSQIPEDITNARPENRVPFNSLQYIRTAALYSTIDFAFADQLFVNLTGRAESASTFGTATQSTFFYPSANVAWQFSKITGEGGAISFGKLRAAYGSVGVQPTPYNTVTYYGVGGYAESWGSTLVSSAYGAGGYGESATLGNPKLKPERKTEIEVGTDLRFLKDRITLGLTYFSNRTKDAILSVATAATTGFNNKTANAARLQNRGFEVDLGADVIKTDNFTWNITGNWSRYRNKVTDLAGTTSLFLAGFTGASSRAVLNQPIGVLWGVDFLKDENGKLILDERGFPQAAAQESVIGNPNPSWRGGLGNTFRYKGLSLYVLMEAVWGGDIWAGTYGILNNFGRTPETDVMTTLTADEASKTRVTPGASNTGLTGTTVAERYQPNADGTYTFRGHVEDYGGGPVALDQTWYLGNGGGFGPIASQFIKDATNWRVREVTLSYRIGSQRFHNTTKLSSVEFSITGRNLFITGPDIKYIGNDPETNLTGPTNGRGLEYFNNPATRSYLFSIRINY